MDAHARHTRLADAYVKPKERMHARANTARCARARVEDQCTQRLVDRCRRWRDTLDDRLEDLRHTDAHLGRCGDGVGAVEADGRLHLLRGVVDLSTPAIEQRGSNSLSTCKLFVNAHASMRALRVLLPWSLGWSPNAHASAPGRSILLSTGTISRSLSIARYTLAMVCASTPRERENQERCVGYDQHVWDFIVETWGNHQGSFGDPSRANLATRRRRAARPRTQRESARPAVGRRHARTHAYTRPGT